MNYEKKYKEALNRAREIHRNEDEKRFDMEWLFPELKESEDERIREGLIKAVSGTMKGNTLFGTDVTREEALAWLEKQGKSSDQIHYWTEEEIEPIISDYLRGVEHYGGMIGRLRCLKPKSLEKQGGNPAPININKMVMEYSQTKDGDFGLPVNCQIRAYRKGLTDAISTLNLEKQGEQKPILDFKASNWYVSKVDGKIHDMTYNPTDKVEPKFKVGDVLCDKSCTTLDKNSQPNIEILDIRAGMYICNNCSFPISQQDEYELVAKRIEPQYAWSDEDENYLQSAENACEYQYGKNTSTILWLKSLKDRIGG